MSRDAFAGRCARSKKPGGTRFLAFCSLAVVPLLAIPGFTVSQDRAPASPVEEAPVVKEAKDVVVRVLENPGAFRGQPTIVRLEVINPNPFDLDKVSLIARLPEQLQHASRGAELIPRWCRSLPMRS